MNNADRIKQIVCAVIGNVEICPMDTLKEKGVNSLNLMTILSRIENEFDIEFPDEDLEMDNFSTIAKIEKIINKLCTQ